MRVACGGRSANSRLKQAAEKEKPPPHKTRHERNSTRPSGRSCEGGAARALLRADGANNELAGKIRVERGGRDLYGGVHKLADVGPVEIRRSGEPDMAKDGSASLQQAARVGQSCSVREKERDVAGINRE